ncbi:hypothetical protein AcW1_001660 [Taiwanofungus camphoratus]|nr:hypothetical protein AcV7_001517 [Antrodia cinnamomea]KAI0945434.1 hypothetical protein AcW1_001660 [Antrodia cinnamomea]
MNNTSLADLSLYLATAEQGLESRQRTAAVWGKNLNADQYVYRDAVMDAQEHAADGKLITWVLAPRNDPKTLDFMCSCETFRRTGVIKIRSQNMQAPKLIEATSYGIASVYTPPQKRRKGYAQHMMRLLHWVLAPRSALPAKFPSAWGSPPLIRGLRVSNAQWSVLYSDVGEDFYRACGPDENSAAGWLVRGALKSVYHLPPSSVGAEAAGIVTEGGVRQRWDWLTENKTKALWEMDAEWMKNDLIKSSNSHTLFAFLPDKGVGAFTIQRTMSFTEAMDPVFPTDIWGVILFPNDVTDWEGFLTNNRNNIDLPTFATWTLDVQVAPRTLVVTRLRANTMTFPHLLNKLVQAAGKNSIERIEIWSLPEVLQPLASNAGWKTAKRRDHLSAFKWYGEVGEDQVEWMFNEKFSWC